MDDGHETASRPVLPILNYQARRHGEERHGHVVSTIYVINLRYVSDFF
jgi:hypothetical protein